MILEQTIYAVVSGEIPQGVDAKTRALLELTEFQRLAPPVSAVLVAAARRDDFDSVRDWFEWALEKFGFEESYVYKLLKIGDMLLLIQDDAKLYKRLFRVSFNNLLPLTQIRIADLPAFLESLDPAIEELNRDQVRDAVRKYLGKPLGESGKGDKEQGLLPGFEDVLNTVDHMLHDGFQFEYAVKDAATAEKSLDSGKCLIAAALEYEKRQTVPNVQRLHELKQDMILEVSEIEEIIAKVFPGELLPE